MGNGWRRMGCVWLRVRIGAVVRAAALRLAVLGASGR